MYRLGELVITNYQILERLKQERRATKPCPFCNSKNIRVLVTGCSFSMECMGCGCLGPQVADYKDPAGLNVHSWVYALKVCHDCWNGRGL